MAPGKKRREPVAVPPVIAGGRRHEAPRLGTPYGYGQDGGIVTATDDHTGRLAWSQRVYDIAYDADIEEDKQDVFITRLELAADGRALLVENERGERFRLDLAGREVERLPGAR